MHVSPGSTFQKKRKEIATFKTLLLGAWREKCGTIGGMQYGVGALTLGWLQYSHLLFQSYDRSVFISHFLFCVAEI